MVIRRSLNIHLADRNQRSLERMLVAHRDKPESVSAEMHEDLRLEIEEALEASLRGRPDLSHEFSGGLNTKFWVLNSRV